MARCVNSNSILPISVSTSHPATQFCFMTNDQAERFFPHFESSAATFEPHRPRCFLSRLLGTSMSNHNQGFRGEGITRHSNRNPIWPILSFLGVLWPYSSTRAVRHLDSSNIDPANADSERTFHMTMYCPRGWFMWSKPAPTISAAPHFERWPMAPLMHPESSPGPGMSLRSAGAQPYNAVVSSLMVWFFVLAQRQKFIKS